MQVNVIVAGCVQPYTGVLGIGIEGKLPWNLPKDLIRFKKITMGNVVIMGRKTWESIPSHLRPLAGRVNIVVSRAMEGQEGIYVARGLKEAFGFAKMYPEKDIYLIGGEGIFSSFFRVWPDCLNKLYLTKVKRTYEVDAYIDLSSIHDRLVLKKAEPEQIEKDSEGKDIPYIYEEYELYKAP